MRTIRDLDELVSLVEKAGDDLFIRWSRGPQADLADVPASQDDLTGVKMPGLSANPLAVEPWWDGRPLDLWVARRIYDYSHLRRQRGPRVRAWVLSGEVTGRGPDNEPLVRCKEPVAWIDGAVLTQAEELVNMQSSSEDWGPLDRK